VAWLPRPAHAATEELQQTCLKASQEEPTVVKPLVMIHAGIWPNTHLGNEQAIVGTFGWPALPDECGMRYARTARADVQMLRRGKWATTRLFVAGWGGLKGGRSRVSTFGGHPDAPAAAPMYNTCSGGRFHKVRLKVTTTITRPALSKVEGRQSWNYPVAVRGNCAKAALSEQRVHKLQEELFGSRF
jgi:hypothetical protein